MKLPVSRRRENGREESLATRGIRTQRRGRFLVGIRPEQVFE